MDSRKDQIINTLETFYRLLRVKQWLKNLLIFAAPFGGGVQPSASSIKVGLLGFIIFSLSASAIYVLNDLLDRHRDRFHPQKKLRPIASGAVSLKIAVIFPIILVAISGFLMKDFGSEVSVTISCYIFMNIMYTFGLKNFPVLELGIVAAGYSLRILFGAQIFNLAVSSWLMVSTFSAAFGIISAKRRSEMLNTNLNQSSKRNVLNSYTENALQATSTLTFGASFTTYSLWLFSRAESFQILLLLCEVLALVLFVFLLLESERGKLESPEDLLQSNKFTIILTLFVVLNALLLYI